jgi:hypothetical protein
MDLDNFRSAEARHRVNSFESKQHISPMQTPTSECPANPREKYSSWMLPEKKGSLSLQTAAVVGSSAAVAAADLAGHANNPEVNSHFMRWR